MPPSLELDTGVSTWIALALAVTLAALHLAAPRIRALPFVPERYMGSFAGGLAVAYVFLHLLPELAAGNEAVGEALSDVVEPSPLLELAIFLVALAGFTVFYGLERLADRHGESANGTGSASVYWLHLSSFMGYNALITYTMILRVRTGLLFAILFTIAMGLHFLLTDRGLAEHYPRRFRSTGRILLAASLLVGWTLAAVAAPVSTIAVALLTALLGGSVLLNVFKEEIPSSRTSSFGWFTAGLVLYSALLAAITAMEAWTTAVRECRWAPHRGPGGRACSPVRKECRYVERVARPGGEVAWMRRVERLHRHITAALLCAFIPPLRPCRTTHTDPVSALIRRISRDGRLTSINSKRSSTLRRLSQAMRE